LKALHEVFSHDLPALNELMHKTGVPELTVPLRMPAGSGVSREMGTDGPAPANLDERFSTSMLSQYKGKDVVSEMATWLRTKIA
jgi:hypothetical protein